MQAPSSQVCVLCGKRAATTRDHVPPKCFFKGLETNLITVPSCYECNNGSSQYDEDVRFYISAQIGKKHQGSARLWEDGAYKSIKRKTELRQSFLRTVREVAVVDSFGASTTRLVFEVPVNAYQAVFERVTRGLYFHHTGRILDQNTPIKITPLTGLTSDSIDAISPFSGGSIGGNACVYKFGVDEEVSNSLWIFQFYDALWIMSQTGATVDT